MCLRRMGMRDCWIQAVATDEVRFPRLLRILTAVIGVGTAVFVLLMAPQILHNLKF